jgi:hypothetical protein
MFTVGTYGTAVLNLSLRVLTVPRFNSQTAYVKVRVHTCTHNG